MRIPHELPPLKGLPSGHRYFADCLRETWTRWMLQAMSQNNTSTWFVTLTFKKNTPRRKAYGAARAWLRNLEMSYFHKTDEGGSKLRWVMVEGMQLREVIHYHLLIMGEGLNAVSKKRWECRWSSLTDFTASSRIHPARATAAPYLAGHISGSGNAQVGGRWRDLNAPKSLACCA